MGKFIEKNAPKTLLLLFFIADVLAINISSFLALFARYDFRFREIERLYLNGYISYMVIYTLTTIIIFIVFRLYSSLWNFAGSKEMLNIFIAGFVAFAGQVCGMELLDLNMPRSYFILSMIFLQISITAIRFSYRFLRALSNHHIKFKSKNCKNLMLVGAGDGGATVMRAINGDNNEAYRICCAIDDNPSKKNKYIQGVKIVGGREKIVEMVKKYDINMIVIAMPSVKRKEVTSILDICKCTGCELKILPNVQQLVNGKVSVSKLRKVEIEDLLDREPIRVNLDAILGYVKGKVVLVTGGAGSIGSEICRQLAQREVGQLIILDIYENTSYSVERELRNKYPDLNLMVLIGSVRNLVRVEKIFETYRPDIVFHAAAHKHVPLMETSPNEAIKNNSIGTYKTAQMASKYKVKKFILISTDKAVNPTNIMGASKRICEMVIQTMNQTSDTVFTAVRFGNVLGSNGSVVPIFRKQIMGGGPVTVTHPDIIRYFMTIPEAVSLVMQAGSYAKGGEIFILNMGNPVKILDLAQNMIRLSGYEPYKDIQIEFTGLRPGEKLYEELLMEEEGMRNTDNNRIFIGKQLEINVEKFRKQISELDEASYHEADDIRRMVKEMVPEYQYK